MEYLEDRTLLNATLTIDASNNLTFLGSGTTPDQLFISSSGSNYTFQDITEPIDVVNSSGTVVFNGTGTPIVTQTAGTILSMTVNGNGGFSGSATIGAGGIAVANNINFLGWESIFVDNPLATAAPGQPISLSATAGSINNVSIAPGATVTTNNGPVSLTGPGGIDLGANILSSGAAITFNNAVNLINDATVDGGLTGIVTFSGRIEGNSNLTVHSGSSSQFNGLVGNTTPLASLTINAGGTTSFNTASVITNNIQTYNDAVALGANATFSGSTIIFGSTVNGSNNSLTVNGNKIFGGLVTGVTSLSASGATLINAAGITTTGSQAYTAGVTLGTGTTLTGSTATFSSTVAGGGNDLNLNLSGPVTINGANFTGIRNLSVGIGGATQLTGSITTTGFQSYSSPVTLLANTTLAGTSIGLSSTINGGSNSLTITGNAVFAGTVSGVNILSVSGTSNMTAGSITTSGAQTYTGGVVLGANLTLNAGPANLNFGSTLNGAFSLTVAAANTINFTGAIGGTTPVIGFTFNNSGAVNLNGPVSLGSGTVTIGGSNNTITVNGIISGSGNLAFAGPGTLTLAANNTYNGATTLQAGNLVINGTQPSSAVSVAGGRLAGTGTTGLLSATGGTVAPGLNGSGILTTGGLSLNSATTYQVDLSGPSPASGFEQLVAAGAINLGSAHLVVTLSFNPGLGISFTIIQNTGPGAITGTFNGLAEGAVLAVNGKAFQVTYHGGAGNDVVLTRQNVQFFAIGVSGHVQLRHNTDGSLITDFLPFGSSYTGGIAAALGDINGDGFPDLVVAATTGNPHVKVYNGAAFINGPFNPANPDASLLTQFFAYGVGLDIGATVAVGDVSHNGFADIITGATAGNPHVKVFNGQAIANSTFNPANPDASAVASFFAYGVNFNIGVNVAVGDVNGDGFADIVTGANAGNPHVKVYNGRPISNGTFNNGNPDASLLAQWFAFGMNFNIGVNVAVGDINGDSFADIIVGASLGNPEIRTVSGRAIANGTFNPGNPNASVLDDFFAYGLNQNIGVSVGAADFESNGSWDILTGNTTGTPNYRVVRGTASGIMPPAVFEGTLSGFSQGISVGA